MKVHRAAPHTGHRLPPESVKTYQVLAPEATHWRSATCAEIDCQSYTQGWRVRVEDLTPQQEYAVRHSGYKFTEVCLAANTTYLVFEAGQPCFKAHEHRLPVGRPGLYLLRDGRPRSGNPRGTSVRKFDRSDQWVEHFAEHQQRIYDRWQQG